MTLMKETWLALVIQPKGQRRQAPQPGGRAGTSSTRLSRCPSNSGSQKQRIHTVTAPHRQRCPSWGLVPGASVLGAADSSSHAMGGSVPASTCHPWERFFSSLQISFSNQRGPETCVIPKPPKYPAKIPAKSLESNGWNLEKTSVHQEPPWGSHSQIQALPWHQWDSSRH